MTITPAHLANSRRLMNKVCRDCANEYTVTISSATRSTRCPACQARYEQERACERAAEQRDKRQGYYKQGVEHLFRVVSDPDGSWGSSSYLSLKDIKELLSAGYLAPGTEFVRAGERLVVEFDEVFCLAAVEG